MKRIQRLRRDESGMSYVFIGLSMMAFISASMLAIDVGMLMTARSQAQNSADAGALAGATALVYDNFTDRLRGRPAVTSAIRASQTEQRHARPGLGDPRTSSSRTIRDRPARIASRSRFDRTRGAADNPVVDDDRPVLSAWPRPTSARRRRRRPRRPTR